MKIFISADIEGVNGINNWDDTTIGKPSYPQFRKQMTEDVLSVLKACFDYDKDCEVFIKDGHDSGYNLDPSDLPRQVKLHRGWEGGPLQMLDSLDDSFDACIFIGYHSKSLSSGNRLAHTMNPRVPRILINGVQASEFLINSYTASYFKVPVIFLSGDEGITIEAKKLIRNIQTSVTNQAVHGATVAVNPELIKEDIYTNVLKALKSNDISPLTLANEFDILIEYRTHHEAYKNSFYPGASLSSDNSITFKACDYYEVLKFFLFVL